VRLECFLVFRVFFVFVLAVVFFGCVGGLSGGGMAGFGGLNVSSPAFENGEEIPGEFGCGGADVNPPLEFSGVPFNAQSLVLIVEDPDAPLGAFVHWMVWNIPPGVARVGENSTPEGAVVGLNDFGRNGYGGPCPPFGTHRYFFKLYALDSRLSLSENARKADVEKAMQGRVLAQATLTGLYSKK